jgi:hypothetical protein
MAAELSRHDRLAIGVRKQQNNLRRLIDRVSYGTLAIAVEEMDSCGSKPQTERPDDPLADEAENKGHDPRLGRQNGSLA